MRNFALVLLTAMSCGVAAADEKSADKPRHPLVLRPVAEGWQADAEDVRRVLHSAAAPLWAHFPGRKLPPIRIEPKGGPITLYARNDQGEIVVRLDTGQSYWAQYAFQFGHEMGHILANYNEDENPNAWFEESLCEVASLYTLRQMSQTWQTKPPYPNWKGFSKALASYAQDRIDAAQLPEESTLKDWFAENRRLLEGRPYQRDKNLVIATALLPLFEQQPARWEAITWLNAVPSTKEQSFEQYLRDWKRHCPPRHRALVDRIAKELGVSLAD